MKYAVIRTGGKQYKVAEGDEIIVERLPLDEKADFICNDVLLFNNEGDVLIGSPLVSNITVFGTVLSHVKGEKIRVAKYKAKVRYRKVNGHRQSLSKVQITTIGDKSAKKTQQNVTRVQEPVNTVEEPKKLSKSLK